MPNLKLFVLGSPRVERAGQAVHIERRRALALLVYLAMTSEQHRRDALATMFWPEYDHTRARAALRRTLAALKDAIAEDVLDAKREYISLRRMQNDRGLWVDVRQFQALLAICRTHGHAETEVCPACIEPLRAAADLYRGDFLAGFSLRDAPDFDEWQLFQAETVRRELAGALERLAQRHAAQQEFEPAIGYARRWLALDPFYEPAHCQLMTIYARAGQRQAALRQYDECARLLERELGGPPQEATTQLYEQIKANALAPLSRPLQALTPSVPPSRPGRPAEPAPPDRPFSLFDQFVRGQLVGRERETAQLGALWHSAAGGQGQVALISGEAGVGKTRLVREVTTIAERAGATILIGRCEAEGGSPYAPIAQMIHAVLANTGAIEHQTPNFVLADLLTLAPHLRLRYPQIAPNPALDHAFERQRLFDSFVAWCEILARATPLLLWVEDVHWADSGTLMLLRHLAQHARAMRLLVAITYRNTDVELAEASVLKNMLIELNRQRLAESITLARLNRDQTRDLLVALFATGGSVSSEFLDRIYAETEGNPFFVEEVCKALIEDGKLYYAGGAWRRSDIDAIVIPQSIRTTILSRIEKLPARVQELLQLAAILGREFDAATLQALSGHDEEMLIEELEHAKLAQLLDEVYRVGQLRFAFGHALIPFTLRASLSGLRRQRLHRRAAAVIETQSPEDLEALAFHFTAAGEREKAIAYARGAAQRAQALYVYETAIQHLQVALSLIETGGPAETRMELLEQLADLHRLRDEHAIAVPLYQEALELWHGQSRRDTMIQVRLYRKIGETVRGTEHTTAVQSFEATARAALEAGMRLMRDQPAHPETIRLLIALSHDAWRTRVPQDWDAAERYARAAVEMAEPLKAPTELSSALDALAVIYAARGLFSERVQIAQQRVALGRESAFGDMRERVHLLNEAGIALIDVGEYAQAEPYLQEAEHIASRMHAIDELAYALQLQAICAFQLDRWDEVPMREKLGALRQRHRHARLDPTCRHIALAACVHALRGEFEQAAVLREESLAFMIKDVPPEQWGRPVHY